MKTSNVLSRQWGRVDPLLVFAGVAVVLLVIGMLYVTLQDDTAPAEQPTGMVERESAAPAPAATTVATPAAAAAPTAPHGLFSSLQLPPYQPTVPAADSPRLAPAEERAGDGVVISGQLLEQLEKEAEDTEASAGEVPLANPL